MTWWVLQIMMIRLNLLDFQEKLIIINAHKQNMEKGSRGVDYIIDDEDNAPVVPESELISSGLKRPGIEIVEGVNCINWSIYRIGHEYLKKIILSWEISYTKISFSLTTKL